MAVRKRVPTDTSNPLPKAIRDSRSRAAEARKSKNIFTNSILARAGKRVALSLTLLAVMYIYFYVKRLGEDRYKTMASISDNIFDSPIGQELTCTADYRRERELFDQCAPKRCGRIVSDSVVSQQEATELRMLAETVFALSHPSGGVSIFDLNSGALSNGSQFVNLFHWIKKSKNSDLIEQHSLDTFNLVKNKILHSISGHFDVAAQNLHLTSPVFFTRITNHKAVTLNDEYWHPHVDKVTYGTFVYTSLLYLSTYGQEFNGGRFIFIEATRHNVTVEPKFGRVLAFTSGSENNHMVEPVSSGARFALTIPFTCDPNKAVKDPSLK